jgi:hypothetical protein
MLLNELAEKNRRVRTISNNIYAEAIDRNNGSQPDTIV